MLSIRRYDVGVEDVVIGVWCWRLSCKWCLGFGVKDLALQAWRGKEFVMRIWREGNGGQDFVSRILCQGFWCSGLGGVLDLVLRILCYAFGVINVELRL